MSANGVVDTIGKIIDGAGVAVMVAGALIASAIAVRELARHGTAVYRPFRQALGRSILLGLELLVAGDIVRTVAVEPTLTSVGVLGIIVVIRTFLSFSLEVEMTGQWPWRRGMNSPG